MSLVIFVSKSEQNPTTRYRIQPLVVALNNRNVKTLRLDSDGGILLRIKLLVRAPFADVIIIQRKLFDRFFLGLLSSLCKKIIFDFDDAIFTKSSGKKSAQRMDRFRHTIDIAWQAWAGNKYLAKVASERKRNPEAIRYVPTVIDLEKYYQLEKTNTFTLIWIGSQSTAKYLYDQQDVLEAIGKQCTNIKLVIVSDFRFQLNHLTVECLAWSEAVELEQVAKANVGIAPMSDDDWSRGKCALKVLQYMAAGLPVISSNVGANADVVEHEVTGYLADTAGEWVDAIHALQKNPDKAKEMGNLGQQRIQTEFNSTTWVEKQLDWLDLAYEASSQ